MKRRAIVLLLLITAAAGIYWYTSRPPGDLVLTGIVTTNDVVVSPQIVGRLEQLLVNEGDTVTRNQLVAVLSPDELRQERDFYSATAAGVGSQVTESEAALRLQESQNRETIAQAEATLASTESQQAAAEAELENAHIALDRAQRMQKDGIGTMEQLDTARTAHEVAKSRIAALMKQIDAQKATVALARSSAEQVAIRQSQLLSNRQQ